MLKQRAPVSWLLKLQILCALKYKLDICHKDLVPKLQCAKIIKYALDFEDIVLKHKTLY